MAGKVGGCDAAAIALRCTVMPSQKVAQGQKLGVLATVQGMQRRTGKRNGARILAHRAPAVAIRIL